MNENNELIELINHIHNITSSILIKFHTGIELTEDEEEVMSQLYICNEQGDIKALEDIPHKNNIYINTLIMSRIKGSKNKKTIILNTNENMSKLDLNTVVVDIDGSAFGTPGSDCEKILIMLSQGATINTVAEYCKSQVGKEPLTIKSAAKYAIVNDEMDKKTGEEKYDTYKLAMKLESEDPGLTVDEMSKIKKSVGKVFNSPGVIGFIWDFIEGK